ncbi:hypothetical protein PIB30_072673 [Stylosanthes scabra]|uniref:Uncharacterized protein n=1 Tax=Stylosanthes scabra TaxID=79078 RepID=A0ABU6TRG5_9FABA|nr:hypothetical protein [Stylosanthes scabra]
MAPKGKAKVHQPPTRFSLRLAALKTRQSRDKARPSRTAPINAEPIEIRSDSNSKENPGEEEPEGPAADHEMDPNPDLEELEEDPEEDEDPEELEEIEEENEMGEEEVEDVEPSDDEYQEYFADYFELAPPAIPDSSDDSTPHVDD